MKLSDLVSILADRGVDSPSTLALFSRRLREAGRVSKAKRGKGAAHMTYRDAARFLIAVFATDHPERANDAEQFFSAARPRYLANAVPSLHPVLIDICESDCPLDNAIAILLGAIAKFPVEILSRVYVDFERNVGAATIVIGDSRLQFEQPTYRALDDLEKSNLTPVQYEAALIQSMTEAAKYSSGKSITSTLDCGLMLLISRALSDTKDD